MSSAGLGACRESLQAPAELPREIARCTRIGEVPLDSGFDQVHQCVLSQQGASAEAEELREGLHLPLLAAHDDLARMEAQAAKVVGDLDHAVELSHGHAGMPSEQADLAGAGRCREHPGHEFPAQHQVSCGIGLEVAQKLAQDGLEPGLADQAVEGHGHGLDEQLQPQHPAHGIPGQQHLVQHAFHCRGQGLGIAAQELEVVVENVEVTGFVVGLGRRRHAGFDALEIKGQGCCDLPAGQLADQGDGEQASEGPSLIRAEIDGPVLLEELGEHLAAVPGAVVTGVVELLEQACCAHFVHGAGPADELSGQARTVAARRDHASSITPVGCGMLAASFSLLLACGEPVGDTGLTDSDTTVPLSDPEPGFGGVFETLNSAERAGRYQVPDGWNLGPIPVMVAYHGTGGEGLQMLNTYAEEATEHGFALVAPDSRVSPTGSYTWEVGTEPGEITEDVLHTRALLEELVSLGVELEEGRLLATGHSGGGSSGPYMATNDGRFNAYGSQHGGAFPGGMGDNLIPGWFSTGEDDDVRDPDHVQDQADDVAKAGYPVPEVRIYPGGHDIGEQERSDLVDWWLSQPSVE